MDRSFLTFVVGAAAVMFGAVWLWSAPAFRPAAASTEATPAAAPAPKPASSQPTTVFSAAPPVITPYQPPESDRPHKLR